ncbi:hypothetical protein BH11ACT8_BH11ACT8_01110 [soil metagenome]
MSVIASFDRGAVLGLTIESAVVTIERGRVALFARTIGEEPGVHTDLDLARAAGHPDLVVPPTFLFSVLNELSQPFGDLTRVGVDLADVLHGEQAFTYRLPVHAGDSLTIAPRYVDAFTKKDGALLLLVRETELVRDGGVVATERATLVVPVRKTSC